MRHPVHDHCPLCLGDGERQERKAVLRKVRILLQLHDYLPKYDNFIVGMNDLAEWLLARDRRAKRLPAKQAGKGGK